MANSSDAAVNAAIAANRFGLGIRPGELSQIKGDARGWLKAQLNLPYTAPSVVSTLPPSSVVFVEQVEAIKAQRELRKQLAQENDSAANNTNKKPETNPRRRVIVEHYLQQVAARYQVATHTDASFRERLVHFWTNHFAVSSDKLAVAALAGTLENEAIRPNLHRHFHDLLLAAESHPAMILYLDNQASTGPNSRLAQLAERRGKQRKVDINENLAREILELHTLGVNGGYTQSDVNSFAKALTGWSVGGGQGRLQADEPGKFVFREALHEPGAQTLLGKRYREEGIDQPLAVFKDLARHPATAQFVATKLVRHFVADDPPAAAVEQVAKVFRDSEGNLPKVHAAVVDCADGWLLNNRKFKTPNEFVISTFRAFDYLPEKPQQVLAPFELLGQRPYTPGSPAGWADIASQWDGPDALMKRIEWATQVGQRAGQGMAQRGPRLSPIQMAEQSLGATLTEHTRMAVQGAADGPQGLVLWLMSPEFLRR